MKDLRIKVYDIIVSTYIYSQLVLSVACVGMFVLIILKQEVNKLIDHVSYVISQ